VTPRFRDGVLGLTGSLLIALPVTAAQADPDGSFGTVDERPRDGALHAVDGEVRSIAQVGGTVVMGGSFTRVGPVTRGAVGLVDTAAKTFQPGFPDVVGAVTSVVPDGSGGWFLGGSFSRVGDQPRSNLAQVNATGVVTAFAPAANGVVNDLVTLPEGDLVVGGAFTSLAGSPAGGLARLSPRGGLVWGGAVTNGAVRTVAVSADATTVYLGGEFSRVSGVSRPRLGAVSAATGSLDTGFAPGAVNLPVNDLLVRSGSVLLVGDFTRVNAVVRNLAGVHLASSSPTSLNVTGIGGSLSAVALDGAGGLYIGGPMQISPEKGNPGAIARVTLSTGAVSAVVPYAETPRSLARSAVTGASGPLVLLPSAGRLLVAGDFSDYGSTTRNGLAAYDLATGALSSTFDPAPDGQVNTVKASADGQAVFVGGEFTTIAGQSHQHLAKLAIVTGTAVPGFGVTSSSYVKDLAVRTDGSTLYVGGNFDVFNGVPTGKLVALDATTGTTQPGFTMPLAEPTNETSEGGLRAMALSPDQTRLMVIGNFRKLAGLDRPLIAQIDVSAKQAVVTPWRTDVYDQPCARSGQVGWMRDIDISPDSTTAYVVSSGHFYYPACDAVNAFAMTPGAASVPTWTKKVGDTLEGVAAGPDALYISGHFRYLETETKTENRFQVAALDPATGAALSRAPSAGGFRGVLTVELEQAGLFAGSDGDAFGVVNHGRNAFWPAPAPGLDVRKTPSRSWVPAPSGTLTHAVRVRNTYSDRSVTLTALTDERLGSLAGSGTCALPQTLAAGATYNCTTAAETVSGAAPSEVTATLTASGTASGASVSDTDRSVVHVIVPPAGVQDQGGGRARCRRLPGQHRPVRHHDDEPRPGPAGDHHEPGQSHLRRRLHRVRAATRRRAQRAGVLPPGSPRLRIGRRPAELPVHRDSDLRHRHAHLHGRAGRDHQPARRRDEGPGRGRQPGRALGLGQEGRGPGRGQLLDHLRRRRHRHGGGRQLRVLLRGAVPERGRVATGHQAQCTRPAGAGAAQPDARRDGDDCGGPERHHHGFRGHCRQTHAPAVGYPLRHVDHRQRRDRDRLRRAKPSSRGDHPPGRNSSHRVRLRGREQMSTGTAPACRVFFSANNTTKFNTTAWALFTRAAIYTSMECGKNMLWTAAGNGSTSYSGADGRTSVAVGLSNPWGLAIDSKDRVYVADASLHAVRRIDVDGTVTTVAGTGTAGFSGDGGPATAAQLNAPVRQTLDAAGNLYIADSANNRIRKVTPAGTISTVVGSAAGNLGDGGLATLARLRTPYDVAIAADGTMYIADRGNHKVRAVTPTGTISTVAGNGVAGYTGDDMAATSTRLNNPYSVDLDADGNLYIADYDNERIRRVDTRGTITTVAGTGVPTADGDGGPATEAGLHKPQYVLVGPDGDQYISEANNNRIRHVHDGLADTLAGSGQFGYLGDGTVPLFSTWQRPSATAFDSQGNLWVTDRNNRRVRVISGS